MQSSQLERRVVLNFLVHQGINNKNKLSRLTNLSKATVYRNLKKIQEGKGPGRKPRECDSLKIKGDDRRCLTQLALCHPKWSSRQLAAEMLNRRNIRVSHRTIQRTLLKSGIKKFKPNVAPPLTDKHKQARVEWCLQHKLTDWSRVVFTDESYFQAFRNVRMMWTRSKPSVGLPKHPPKVMVWGGISWRGVTPLKITKGHVNSESYQDILSECLIETCKELYPEGFILQQDNATPHTSKSTKKFLEENKIKTLKWPANSPDLNPIENLWSVMKNRVEKLDPRNTDAIINALNHVWDDITQELRESLINSMQEGIRLCLESGGEKIPY